jgi:hypothetical protein
MDLSVNLYRKSVTLVVVSSVLCLFSFAQHSPEQPFKGTIGKTLSDSKPDRIKYNPDAPKNAPNVIYHLSAILRRYHHR